MSRLASEDYKEGYDFGFDEGYSDGVDDVKDVLVQFENWVRWTEPNDADVIIDKLNEMLEANV